MVKYKTILQTIDNYVQKCGHTLAEIRELLNDLSPTEKRKKLLENNLLNDGELKVYDELIHRLGYVPVSIEDNERIIEDVKDENPNLALQFQNLVDDMKKGLEEDNEKLFDYEKRLYNGYTPREPKNIQYDESEYNLEKQYPSDHFDGNEDNGEIEQNLIDKQREVDYSVNELLSMWDYYGNGCPINSYLNDGRHWNELSADEKEENLASINRANINLSSAIGKSVPLEEPLVVFHGGYFDVGKIVGDKIKFKGYISTSFQQSIAERFGSETFDKESHYNFKILLPKGSKGLCANDTSHGGRLTTYKDEHEFLLDKAQTFEIVDIDYDNQVVTIRP